MSTRQYWDREVGRGRRVGQEPKAAHGCLLRSGSTARDLAIVEGPQYESSVGSHWDTSRCRAVRSGGNTSRLNQKMRWTYRRFHLTGFHSDYKSSSTNSIPGLVPFCRRQATWLFSDLSSRRIEGVDVLVTTLMGLSRGGCTRGWLRRVS